MTYSRSEVVNLINSWEGKKVSDGSYKEIIDIYNTLSDPPRGLKMQYDWPWCAATYSAVAIKLGYLDIMPIEISCEELIKKAKVMGIWNENDDHVPKLGDGILYDWDDTGIGDCVGWSDHVGIVTYVNESAGYMVVTEGNYSKSVKKRTISLNGKYIRGFITPKFNTIGEMVENPVQLKKDIQAIACEVISGAWGNMPDRKQNLEKAGYNYEEVRDVVNYILNGSVVWPSQPAQDQTQSINKTVKSTCYAKMFDDGMKGTYKTSANLYCRNDAGTNKKALCLIPKNTKVCCYGYYNMANGVKWPYIQVIIDGVQYFGFSCINYLDKQ